MECFWHTCRLCRTVGLVFAKWYHGSLIFFAGNPLAPYLQFGGWSIKVNEWVQSYRYLSMYIHQPRQLRETHCDEDFGVLYGLKFGMILKFDKVYFSAFEGKEDLQNAPLHIHTFIHSFPCKRIYTPQAVCILLVQPLLHKLSPRLPLSTRILVSRVFHMST